MSNMSDSTVTMPLSEYQNLRQIKKDYEELVEKIASGEPDVMVIVQSPSWTSKFWFKNPDDAIKRIVKENNSLKVELDLLKETDDQCPQ
jgi:hypothetical protein